MSDLSGKVAVVTGAGRGIGRAIARVLAVEGADVALCARTQEEIDAVAVELRGLGRRAVAKSVDVAKWDQVQAFARDVAAELGKVAVLVNNAGGGVERNTPIAASDPPTWWRAPSSSATQPARSSATSASVSASPLRAPAC